MMINEIDIFCQHFTKICLARTDDIALQPPTTRTASIKELRLKVRLIVDIKQPNRASNISVHSQKVDRNCYFLNSMNFISSLQSSVSFSLIILCILVHNAFSDIEQVKESIQIIIT